MTDFSIDLTVPGASICYLKPKTLRTDATGCAGVDVAKAEATIPAATRLTTLVRFDDWGFTVVGTWQPKRDPGPMSREEGRGFLRGAASSGGAFKLEKQEPDFLVLNDLQVLRFTMVSADADAPVNAVLTYVVVGKDSLVQLAFLTNAEHLGRVREIAEKAMASVKMPTESSPASWSDSRVQSHAFQAGYHAGKALANLLLLIGICIGGVLVYRAIRRGRANAPK